ncbi:MAG: 3'-5' exonuclease [Microgenomates group bacterium]|jgi:DNA polymerase-3 subunit epsilon
MNIKQDKNPSEMRDRPLIFLDIESTGLDIQNHEIIQIGAIKTSSQKPFKMVAEINLKVKPERIEDADKDALKLVGYTEAGWKDAISLQEALTILDDFAKGGVLVGYNVNFDWAILYKAYHGLGRIDPFYYHRVDVMSMAYLTFFPKEEIKRFSLGEICTHLKINRDAAHDALDDAKVTYLVFKKLMK